MKNKIAFLANSALMVLAAIFVSTNSFYSHRPETPAELLKK